MVDAELFDRVMRLGEAARRELRDAIDGSLGYDDVPDEVLTVVDERLARMGSTASPDSVSLDDDEREVRGRRRGHAA